MLLQAADISFGYGLKRNRPGSRSVSDRGPGELVVRDVSLAIAAGAFVGVLGPNGSGKTTLIKMLSGALTPTSGRVTLDGNALDTLPRRTLARRVAVVPQETRLTFDYTALEIVLMGRYPHLGPFEIEGPDDIAIAEEALRATGTLALAERAFTTLSGGEKQRVIIASALAQVDRALRPGALATGIPSASSLLFLDEPTASLDLKYQLEVAALATTLNRERGMTIVLSTHDLRFARAVCREIVLLLNGQVLAAGPAAEVMTPALVGELYGIRADVAAPLLA